MPLRSRSNGRDALRRIFVAGQGSLAFETRKDAEGVNAFGNAAGQGDVALAEPQHLHALDDPRISGGEAAPTCSAAP